MTENDPTFDPKYSRYSRAYINAINPLFTGSSVDDDCYNIQYHHSIIDSDNVNDSIKVKILYNELMTLREALANSQGRLKSEVYELQDKNKKLEDEIASIKQTLYFG